MWNVILGGIPVKRWAAYASLLIAGSASPVRVGLVSGDSMAPSLRSGQAYVYAPSAYLTGPVTKGDVLVFRHEGTTFLKRVLAAPGDAVHVLRYEDGAEEVLPAWKLRRFQSLQGHPWLDYVETVRIVVPQGQMYVVGDNIASSLDSRDFGLVPLNAVQGKLLQAPPPSKPWQALATTDVPSLPDR